MYSTSMLVVIDGRFGRVWPVQTTGVRTCGRWTMPDVGVWSLWGKKLGVSARQPVPCPLDACEMLARPRVSLTEKG